MCCYWKNCAISKTTQNACTEHAASIYLAVALHNKKHTPKRITTKRISSTDHNKRASDFKCTHFIKACYQAKVHSKQTVTIENGRWKSYPISLPEDLPLNNISAEINTLKWSHCSVFCNQCCILLRVVHHTSHVHHFAMVHSVPLGPTTTEFHFG